MSNGGSYYALSLNVDGTNAPAYFSVTPTSNLTISQGGATILPSPASSEATMVNIYPQTLQIGAPGGTISAGVTIITSESRISGRVMVSPPVNVATVITGYGAGGKEIGQAIIDPNVGSGTFDFATAGNAFADADDARQFLEQKFKR